MSEICTCLSPEGPHADRDEPGIPASYLPALEQACAVHGWFGVGWDKLPDKPNSCVVGSCDGVAVITFAGVRLCARCWAKVQAQGAKR